MNKQDYEWMCAEQVAVISTWTVMKNFSEWSNEQVNEQMRYEWTVEQMMGGWINDEFMGDDVLWMNE